MASPPKSPEQAADEAVRRVFLALGYDPATREDMRKLASTLRWASEQQEEESRNSVTHIAALWSVIAALLGGLATSVVQWWVERGSGGH